MKYYLFILLVILTGIRSSAQGPAPKATISGKILDSVTRAGIDYATIKISSRQDQKAIQVITSDPNGNFTATNLPAGEYVISVGYMGYHSATADHIVIAVNQSQLRLKPILLVSSSTTLKVVNIRSQSPAVQNKIDKLVYDPANDLSAQGGSAIDVLKKVPMLSVDINGNVELLGSPGVNFLINGKPSSIFGASLADALQAIPASQIKNIEVISNPGAKYDAQGTAGVINIVLKDNNIEGINASANIAAGTRQSNTSFNLNAKKKNFGIGTFFSGNRQSNTTSLNSKRLINADGVEVLNQQGSSRINRSGFQTGINGEWTISPKDNLNLSLGYDHIGNTTADQTAQSQTSFDSNNLPLITNTNRSSASRLSANTLQWSAGYKRKFNKENQELDVLYQSNISRNNSSYSQLQENAATGLPTLGTSSASPGKVRETGIEINYTQPVADNFILETGTKAFFKTINSNVDLRQYNNGEYVTDPSQSYSFRYNRNIYAYYLSASFSAFHAVDVKAGLRYEYTDTHADFPDTFIPGYGSLNPSIVLSHTISPSQSVKLSYSRRIERPDYSELNPYADRSDPYNIITGNPMLAPEIGNNMELSYNKSFTGGTILNISLFYRRNSDDIKSYTTFYPVYTEGNTIYENVSLTRRTNTGGETKTGSNIYLNIPLSPKMTFRSNAMIVRKTIAYDFNGINQDTQGMEYRMNMNLAYQFNNDFSAEAFGNYNSQKVGIQGRSASFLFYTLALRKQFLNKNAAIGFSATNPFNKYINQRSNVFQSGNQQYTIKQVPYRSFAITFSYKFGNLKFDKKEEHKDPVMPDTL